MEALVSAGFVLRRRKHLEHDVRLSIFLKDFGKVLVLLKGALKMGAKLKSFQEPFTAANFQLSIPPHGSYARLIGAEYVSSNQHLSRHMSSFEIANKCCEMVDVMIPFRAPSP